MTTVEELGESGVLRRVLAQLSDAQSALLGPGDDCAVLSFRGDTVVTSDTMIEGPDFRLAWHDGFELGWKLAATNLSDVAAMGARPTALTVSFACPAHTEVDLLAEIARGIDAACRALAPGCGVVGGDLGRAGELVAAVTALGDMEGRVPVRRSAAAPGDVIAYAGDLGLAGLGLSLLFRNCADRDGVAHNRGLAKIRTDHPVEIGAQLAPSPPILLGAVAAEAGATAMMDVSDGLALDAQRMGRASGVTLDLSPDLLKHAFGEQQGVKVPLAAMLEGGEDHGLLACFPSNTELPEGFREIGTVRDLVPGAPPAELAAPAPRDDGEWVMLAGESYVPRGWDPYATLTRAAD